MNYNAIVKRIQLVRGAAVSQAESIAVLNSIGEFSDDDKLNLAIRKATLAHDKFLKALDGAIEHCEGKA